MQAPLYHFTQAEYALKDIRERRLKIAQFDDLNDPFELRNVRLLRPEDIFAFNMTRAEISERFGLLCFTELWNSILQWSHYGEHHRGICLGFEVSYLKGKFGPVKYPSGKLDYPGEAHLNVDFMNKMLHTKYRGWEYEKEWRVLIELKDAEWSEGSKRFLYFADFGNELALREVILGAECKVPLSEVRDALAGYTEAVQLSQIQLDDRDFRLHKRNF